MSFKIRCYIADFKFYLAPITSQSDSDTSVLREEIHTQASKSLAHVDAAQLILYRVNRVIDMFDQTINIHTEVESMFIDGNPSATNLRELGLEYLSDTFPTSERNAQNWDRRLHIIVVVPKSKLLLLLLHDSIFRPFFTFPYRMARAAITSLPLSLTDSDLSASTEAGDASGSRRKRPRSSEVQDYLLGWLQNWHSHLWKKGSDNPVFRKVQVTADDYRKLYNLLQDVPPDQPKTTIEVKSRFLASLQNSEARYRNDEATAATTPIGIETIKDDFPIDIEYADLTSLFPLERVPTLAIIRNEYAIMEKLVKNTRPDWRFILITGSPGIGQCLN